MAGAQGSGDQPAVFDDFGRVQASPAASPPGIAQMPTVDLPADPVERLGVALQQIVT